MNSDLQNKLYHFEADPPPEVWNRIDDALDTTEEEFPQRLYKYEQEPPSAVWQNIEATLEEGSETFKVVPITRYKKPIRYVAAAASIIAIIFLFNTLRDSKVGAGAIAGPETLITTNQSSILPTPKLSVTPVQSSKQNFAVNSPKDETKETQTKPRKTLAFIKPQALSSSFSIRQNFIPGRADKETLFDVSVLDSYMVYSDEDGNAMKLPKKLFGLVNCQDGDASCKERVQQLRQKLASVATTSDFGGIP